MSRQQLGTVGEVRSMSSIHLGIRLNQEKYTEKLRCENMDELMAAYYAYIHNGDIFKEVKGFRLAHGSICSAYAHRTPCDAFYMQQHSNRAVEALKDTLKNVQPVTLSELSPADQETYYTPRTPGDTRWYNKVYENQYFGNNRVIADLSLQYNRDAATHLGFQTDAWDGKFHVTENQRFLPPESLPENPNELWGAVGHQPVGFFPCVIHNALHTDVSYASIGTPTRKKNPAYRSSFPCIRLEYTRKDQWEVHVEVLYIHEDADAWQTLAAWQAESDRAGRTDDKTRYIGRIGEEQFLWQKTTANGFKYCYYTTPTLQSSTKTDFAPPAGVGIQKGAMVRTQEGAVGEVTHLDGTGARVKPEGEREFYTAKDNLTLTVCSRLRYVIRREDLRRRQ